MPGISVVVPVYKVEAYLHRCVDSILNQSFRDFELILVDDGSPDNCGVICDTYAEKDSRVHVIHQSNGGLSAARNAGLEWALSHSDSRWITFVDSDDWIHREYLAVLHRAAEDTDSQIAVCGMVKLGEYRSDEVQDAAPNTMTPEEAYCRYYGMCMSACARLFRKELFREIRFPLGKLHEDCYVTHIPTFAAERIAVCDVPMYYYFFNPESITRVIWNPRRLQEIESHELRLSWLKEQGYEMAWLRELEVSVVTLYEHTEVLMEQPDAYPDHFRQLREKLLQMLKLARKHGRMAFEMEYLWIYTMAYGGPGAWRFLRKIRSIRDKNC